MLEILLKTNNIHFAISVIALKSVTIPRRTLITAYKCCWLLHLNPRSARTGLGVKITLEAKRYYVRAPRVNLWRLRRASYSPSRSTLIGALFYASVVRPFTTTINWSQRRLILALLLQLVATAQRNSKKVVTNVIIYFKWVLFLRYKIIANSVRFMDKNHQPSIATSSGWNPWISSKS